MYANVVYSAAGKHISQIALVVFAHIGVPFSNLRIGGVYPCNFPRFRVFSFNQANIGQLVFSFIIHPQSHNVVLA